MTATQEERKLLDELTNEVPNEYARLIAENPLYSSDTSFVDQLAGNIKLPTFARDFSSAVGNRDFVDLGCGIPYLAMAQAREHGARKYVGVDKNLYCRTHDTSDGFPAIFVEDDILRFVSKMPSNRGNLAFFLSGLQPVAEDMVKSETGRDYLKCLAKEISRVSVSDDAVIVEDLGATPALVGETLLDVGYIFVPSHEIVTVGNGREIRKDPRYMILRKT